MEATPEQAAEGQAVVRVLATVLERLVAANEQISSSRPTDQSQITKFHALKAPGISVLAYLERIHKYASCSTECFVLALIYIDRLIQKNNFFLTELNVHRVVITAVLLAAKFFDDAYYNNAYYAKVGGVMVQEMNSLEVEFLFRINFSLHANPEVYSKYQRELLCHAATEQGLSSEVGKSFIGTSDISMVRSGRVVSCDGTESDSDGQSSCRSQTIISEISSTETTSPRRTCATYTRSGTGTYTTDNAEQNYRRAISPSPSPTYAQYCNEGVVFNDHTLKGHLQPQLLTHHDHAQVGAVICEDNCFYTPATYDKPSLSMNVLSGSRMPYHAVQSDDSVNPIDFNVDQLLHHPIQQTTPQNTYFPMVTPIPTVPSVPITVSVKSPSADNSFNQFQGYGQSNPVILGTIHQPSNGYFFHNAYQQTTGANF